LIDWGLAAISAQIGYIGPFKIMLQLKKVKLMKKVTMYVLGIHTVNHYNK